MLRALHDPHTRAGLVVACRLTLGPPDDYQALVRMPETFDDTHAALDDRSVQLRRHVANQTVVPRDVLERCGVRVRIDARTMAAAGGTTLRTGADAQRQALGVGVLRAALVQFMGDAVASSWRLPRAPRGWAASSTR
jgi:hypothetical protein